MNRLMLAAATILILAGGTVSGETTAAAADSIRPASGKSEPAESGGGDTKKSTIEIVRVEPIIIQLPGPGHLRRSMSISLSLTLSDTDHRDGVIEKRAKLKARIFEAWAAPPLVKSGEENFDPEEIKRRAQRASDHLFGTGIVSGVLIEDIHEVLIR